MNFFKAKTFFQIEYFRGWSDKKPQPANIKGPKFLIKSPKTGKELSKDIDASIVDKTAINFILEEIHPTVVTENFLTEDEFTKKLLHLKLNVVEEQELQVPQNKRTIDNVDRIKNGGFQVYVTNATARSIAYNVCLFMNKEKGIEDIEPQDSEVIRYQELFIGESTEFLNVYLRMKLHLNEFLDSLSEEELLRFFKEKAISKIKMSFRHIYHIKGDCEYLLADYRQDDIHRRNSGIFEGIKLDSRFLDELGFRGCQKCTGYLRQYTYKEVITSTAKDWGLDK